MNIILVRHPRTVANETHLIYGRTDYPYAKLGHEQYDWVIDQLSTRYNFQGETAIISSPRERALNLAKGIGKALEVDVKVNEAISEMDFGVFEGLTMDEVMTKFPKEYEDFTTRFEETVIPEGESYQAFTDRLEFFCEELEMLGEIGRYKDVIVVSHGGVTRELLERLTGMIPGGSWSVNVGNGCIITLSPVNEGFVISQLQNFIK